MIKSSYQPTTLKSQYIYKNTKKSSNFQSSPYKKESEYNENEIDSDFYEDFNPYPKDKISRQSNEKSPDKLRDCIAQAKINKKESNSKKSYAISRQSKKENFGKKRHSNKKNEVKLKNAFYYSPDPDLNTSPPYDSPLFMNNERNNWKNSEEIGFKSNFSYQSKKIDGKKAGIFSNNERYEYINKNGKKESKYEKSVQASPSGIEGISPLGYVENNSSESDFDANQIKSFDNYQYSIKTNNTNRSNYNRKNNDIKNENNNQLKLNYELEEPELYDYLPNNKKGKSKNEIKHTSRYINRSQIRNKIDESYTYTSELRDFQSPERDLNESKKFRKVNVKMIDSRGPSNDDKKINKIITKEILETKKYKNENYKYSKDPKVRIKAARIIQAWWRSKNFREEEVYDITVKSAVKLQSLIRGFLVRKKVLRYITLAIYYQSFCDKLQDVLCNYVKKIIFKLLKEKYISKSSKEIILKRKQKLINIVEKKIQKNHFYILKILEKWKEIAYKLKKNKNKEITRKIKTQNNYIINESINKSRNYNLEESQNMHIKEVKINTFKNSSLQNLSISNNNKSHKITKSTKIEDENKINNLLSQKSSISRMNYEKYFSPNTYSINSIKKKKVKKTYSPYPREKINEKKSEINVHKSYNTSNYNRNAETIKYTTINKTTNYIDHNIINKEKTKTISPEFGTLRNINNKKLESDKNTKTIKITEKKRTLSNTIDKNMINKEYATIDTSKRDTKKIIKTIVGKTENQNLRKFNTNTNFNIKTSKTANIYNEGVVTKLKVPILKKIDSFTSKGIYSQGKEKHVLIKKIDRTFTENNRYNSIDNQLSLSIVKLPDENGNKSMKTTIEEPEKIKIKEKIIIQKEKEPETAEEGVGFQIFEMQISKRISLYIKPSTEIRQKITNEQKEIDIIKKREREKNKLIDKYKDDIERHKFKRLLDTLRRAIRIIESFKKRILQKKLYQYRNKCSYKPLILEIDPMDDFQVTDKPKEKKDSAVQINQPLEKKVKKNFKILQISKIIPVSYYYTKKEKPQKVTKSKFNILSKITKKDQSQQSDSWNKQISPLKNKSINFLYSKDKSKEKITRKYFANNSIDDWNEIEYIRSKPKMVDDEVQHEYEPNCIEAESIEFLRIYPKLQNTSSQYENIEPKISEQKKFSIINKSIEKKKETKEAQCNTIIKNTVEEGINAVEEIEKKPKNVEIKLRTVKRSLTKMEIPLLKKLWLRKAFRTFRENCRRPPFHLILEREFLRMAFLRWRFIRGYGPDRYGNAYDRDGNLLYRIKGKVADFQIQNEEKKEVYEQSTQYIPEKNSIFYNRSIEIFPSYKKVKKKETKDKSIGNNIKMEEKIQRKESFHINQSKKKAKNSISRNSLILLKKNKILREKYTQIPKYDNEIDKMDDFKVIDDEGFVKKAKRLRLKEILPQIIYKKGLTDKLNLSEALRKWLKQTLLLMRYEEIEIENNRRMQTKIKKNDRFALTESISREETGTQMNIVKNTIQNTSKFNVIKNIQKKNAEINVNFPSEFDLELIRPKKERNIIFEPSKKSVVFKTQKENTMNIYSREYLFREEIKRGIHHQMTEEARRRVNEILYNFFITKGEPISLLRKYLTIWNRKTNYLALNTNARIITRFCRRNLYNLLNSKRWKKISEKLLLKEKIKLIKLSKEMMKRINKIFDLIRITRIYSTISKKKYLHFILIAWLSYVITIKKKRTNVKSLYQNMITTYMNMADDVFGNNQINNPSVQDALYEAVNTNKFRTKNLQDVPIAKEYYNLKKKTITTMSQQVIKYYGINEDKENETKDFSNSKSFLSNQSITTSFKSNINENKRFNENNRYNILNKYKTNNYSRNNKNTIKIIKDNEDQKEEIFDNTNGKLRSYRIKLENDSERKDSKGGSKIYKNTSFISIKHENSKSKKKSKAKTYSDINKDEDEEERSESKGRRKSYRKEKENEKEGTNINTKIIRTYKIEKEEKRSESKGKLSENESERSEKDKRYESKGKKSFKSEKGERFESKGRKSLRSERSEKEEKFSESRGRKSFKSEKEERSESKGSKRYISKGEIDPNADFNNHKYFESKKMNNKTQKFYEGDENISVITIKAIKGQDIKKNYEKIENDETDKNIINNEKSKEKRRVIYGEKKLFRRKKQQLKNNEDIEDNIY